MPNSALSTYGRNRDVAPGGASLYEIGAVLRHRSIDMAAYYAKVDVNLLKQVAQP